MSTIKGFVKITVDQFVILTFAFLRVRSIRTPRVITSPVLAGGLFL